MFKHIGNRKERNHLGDSEITHKTIVRAGEGGNLSIYRRNGSEKGQ